MSNKLNVKTIKMLLEVNGQTNTSSLQIKINRRSQQIQGKTKRSYKSKVIKGHGQTSKTQIPIKSNTRLSNKQMIVYEEPTH